MMIFKIGLGICVIVCCWNIVGNLISILCKNKADEDLIRVLAQDKCLWNVVKERTDEGLWIATEELDKIFRRSISDFQGCFKYMIEIDLDQSSTKRKEKYMYKILKKAERSRAEY